MDNLLTGIALLLASSFDPCLLPSLIYGIHSKSKLNIMLFGIGNGLLCIIILDYVRVISLPCSLIFLKLAAGICVGFLGHAFPLIWNQKKRTSKKEQHTYSKFYPPQFPQEYKNKKELPPQLKKYRLLGLLLTVIFCFYGLSVDINSRRTLFEGWAQTLGLGHNSAPIVAIGILIFGWFLRSSIGTFVVSAFLRLLVFISNFYKKI